MPKDLSEYGGLKAAFWNNPVRYQDKWGLAAGDSPTWWGRLKDFFKPKHHIILDEVYIPNPGPQKRPSDQDGRSSGAGGWFSWGSMIDYSGYYGPGPLMDGGGGNPDGGSGSGIEKEKLKLIDNLATGVGINMSVKEASVGLAKKSGDIGKAGERFLSITKFIGKATGITGAFIAVYEYRDDPTTAGLIKVGTTIGLVFVRVNPFVAIGLGIADVSGASDWLYQKIGDSIDKKQ